MSVLSSNSSQSSRPARVLLIDDDPLVQRIATRVFTAPTYACTVAGTAREGLSQLSRLKPDVIILDNVLPDGTGLDLLPQIVAHDRRLPVLLITAVGGSGNTIEAMKRGAFDFLAKPLNLNTLQSQVQRALQARKLMLAPVELTDPQSSHSTPVLIGETDAMREVYKAIGRVAPRDVPALIAGEPGTGKELVARLVYENGPRAGGPFLTVKCSDFTLPWVESELLGHEPGAFPGAATARTGKIEQCRGGVLLLKEVGDLPMATQSKLLELLRHRTFQRLGSSETLQADISLLATTSEDLSAAAAAGRFQADLLYALGSFTIALPPLRQRREDIPLLVEHFVKRLTRIGRSYSGEVPRVSPEAMALFAQYEWPGNVDELQSVLKRALIEGQGTVLVTPALSGALAQPRDGDSLADGTTSWRALIDQRLEASDDQLYDQAILEMERRILPLIMHRCGGSQVKAAKALGMTRGSLRKKLRLHGLLAGPAAAEEGEAESSATVET